MSLQAYIQNNHKKISFDNQQKGKFNMILRNATIFWNFTNIKKGNNDDITDTSGTKLDILTKGYYTLDDLETKFNTNNITLTRNNFDNTCSITPTVKDIKLGNLGVMLGFAKDYTFTKDTKFDGTKAVDVHHRLRYVKLSADIVDKSNFSFEGKRSDVFAFLPVDTSQRLFSSRTVYSDLDIRVPIMRNFSMI